MEADDSDNAKASCSKHADKPAGRRRRQEEQHENDTGKIVKRPAVQRTPADPLPQHGPPALHPGLPSLPSLPDEVLLLLFNKLSVRDTVRCAAVCRSWRSLLRSKASWAGLRLRLQLTLTEKVWDKRKPALKKETQAIIDALQCQLACGLLHATDLDVGFDGDPATCFFVDYVDAECAMYSIAHSLFHSLSLASQPPLTIDSLSLAHIIPDRKLCEALAPHCRHVKTLHLTYSAIVVQFWSRLPTLQHVLEACPALEEINLGCTSTRTFRKRAHMLTALREIAVFAQSRSRPLRCVREQPSERFGLYGLDLADMAHLLPCLGFVHFEVCSDLKAPFTVPVPGIHCHLHFRGDYSDSREVLSHLHQCQAAYHALTKRCERPSAVLQAILSTPSVRALHQIRPSELMPLMVCSNILRFTHRDMSEEDLRVLSVACPNLSCLSVSLVKPAASSTAAAPLDAFPTFPSLIHLWLATSNSALASHIASTSPNLTKLTLYCPQGFETLFKAAFALPFLTSLKIHRGDGSRHSDKDRQHDDAYWLHDECADTKATTSSSAAPSAPAVSCAGVRLKHLHLHITSAAGLGPDSGPLCVLLDNSSTTLESLHMAINSITCMHSAMHVLLTGRFARLRWATISVPPDSISKLSATHPLCSWSVCLY